MVLSSAVSRNKKNSIVISHGTAGLPCNLFPHVVGMLACFPFPARGATQHHEEGLSMRRYEELSARVAWLTHKSDLKLSERALFNKSQSLLSTGGRGTGVEGSCVKRAGHR